MADASVPRPREIRTGRLEAFSDGVFAIAITLLVLEISVPEGSKDDLLGAVVDQWASYLAYVASFSTVGAVWLAHSVITEYLDRADALFVRLNLLLLMIVSFLPFPTKLLAEYIGDDDPERVAATKLTPGMAGYVVLIALGLFLPIVAIVGCLVIAVALIIPFGIRKLHASTP